MAARILEGEDGASVASIGGCQCSRRHDVWPAEAVGEQLAGDEQRERLDRRVSACRPGAWSAGPGPLPRSGWPGFFYPNLILIKDETFAVTYLVDDRVMWRHRVRGGRRSRCTPPSVPALLVKVGPDIWPRPVIGGPW